MNKTDDLTRPAAETFKQTFGIFQVQSQKNKNTEKSSKVSEAKLQKSLKQNGATLQLKVEVIFAGIWSFFVSILPY